MILDVGHQDQLAINHLCSLECFLVDAVVEQLRGKIHFDEVSQTSITYRLVEACGHPRIRELSASIDLSSLLLIQFSCPFGSILLQ